MQLDLDHGVVAAVSAIVGGIVTKLITLSGKKMQLEFTEGTEIRRTLGKRCEKLEQDLVDFRKEVDHWQQKYYLETSQLKQEMSNLRVEASVLSIQLTDIRHRGWIPEKEKDRYE